MEMDNPLLLTGVLIGIDANIIYEWGGFSIAKFNDRTVHINTKHYINCASDFSHQRDNDRKYRIYLPRFTELVDKLNRFTLINYNWLIINF